MIANRIKKETFIVVMPSFNEEKRIEKTISSWAGVLEKFPGSEVLVIDGASTDKTREKIKKLQKKYKFLKLIHKPREGYGKDLIHGYKSAINSMHDWVFQTDADGHFDAKEFYKLWGRRKSSPFIIGRRINRKDSKSRTLLSALIQIWILILVNKRVGDSNVPFRLIKRTYLKQVIGKVPPNTIAPNIFLTIIAAKGGHNLHHIPIKHRARKNGHNKLRIFKGAFEGFFELILFALFRI